MNNFTYLIQNLLGLERLYPPANNAVLMIGIASDEELNDISQECDWVVSFDPSWSLAPTSNDNPKIRRISALEPQDAVIISVDGHVANRMIGTELTILSFLSKVIEKNKPFIFARAENPDLSQPLVDHLEHIGYDSYYWFKVEKGKANQTWLFNVPKSEGVANFGWQSAKETGHPLAPAPVPPLPELIITP